MLIWTHDISLEMREKKKEKKKFFVFVVHPDTLVVMVGCTARYLVVSDNRKRLISSHGYGCSQRIVLRSARLDHRLGSEHSLVPVVGTRTV